MSNTHPLPAWARLAPIALIPAFVALHPIHTDAYHWSVAEDSLVEWVTALAYVLAVPLAMLTARRLRRRGYRIGMAAYLLLGVGFVFIAGEEISWGQRLFGFDGPEALVAANIQNEANVHNLLGRYGLHVAYILVGLWGAGVGRWVCRRVTWLHPTHLYAPPRTLVWWFLPVAGYYLYVDYVGRSLLLLLGDRVASLANGPARFQEVPEVILAGGFLLFVIGNFRWAGRTAVSGDDVALPTQQRDAPARHRR